MALTPTQLFVGGALLLGGGYALTRRARRSPKRAVSPPVPPVQEPSSPTPPPPTGDFVGAPGYSWPNKDIFPTQARFEQWLGSHGYAHESDGSVLDDSTRSAVGDFQLDFEAVRKYLADNGLLLSSPYLVNDGLIGDKTIAAMVEVDYHIVPLLALSWPEITQAVSSGLLSS